jgi:hypothetical protein
VKEIAMSDNHDAEPHKAGLFDIRFFIGALLGIYGVILVLTGLFGTSDAELAKSEDINVNLWTGVALVVASIVFIVWARLRPVVVPASADKDDDEAAPGHGH